MASGSKASRRRTGTALVATMAVLVVSGCTSGRSGTVATSKPSDPAASLGSADVVTVYFLLEDEEPWQWSSYAPVKRSSRVELGPVEEELDFAMRELVKGPAAQEREQGIVSMFSSDTADLVRDVAVEDGEAVVDFQRLLEAIPSISTTHRGTAFMVSLQATVFEVDGVDSVEFRLDGSCAAFWELLESSCHEITRSQWQQTVRALEDGGERNPAAPKTDKT